MNATVQAALNTQLTAFQTGVQDQIIAVLPIAIPLAITVSLVFFGWRLFRGMAHV